MGLVVLGLVMVMMSKDEQLAFMIRLVSCVVDDDWVLDAEAEAFIEWIYEELEVGACV